MISLFYLQTHSEQIPVDHLQNTSKFKSSDTEDVQVTKFRRQIPKIISDKCGFEKICKNVEKILNLNSNSNVGKYDNQMPIIDLVPPAVTSKDYYTYFNRRKKELKVTNRQVDPNYHILQNNNIKNGKKPMKNHTVDEDIPISHIRDHAPAYVTEEKSQNQSKYDNNPEETSPTNLSQISHDGDRVEFQIQGHEGPKTYIFGFDTGAGKNRQYRLEERLNDGTVKGHYGYYDARGKLRTVKYIAKPIEGYQEKHHETINYKGKN